MYDRTLKMGHGFRDEMSNFKKPKKPSFPFISVAERQRLKLRMLEDEEHQLLPKNMKKDYLWRHKECSQNIWTVTAQIIWDQFEIRDDVSMNILIFLAGISRTVACRRQITKLFCPV